MTIRSSPSSTVEILAACIPDARLYIAPGGGHLFLLDRPSQSPGLVADFLHGRA